MYILKYNQSKRTTKSNKKKMAQQFPHNISVYIYFISFLRHGKVVHRYFVPWGVVSNLIRTTEWSTRLPPFLPKKKKLRYFVAWVWWMFHRAQTTMKLGCPWSMREAFGLTSQWSFQSCKLAYREGHLTCHVQWKRYKRYHWGLILLLDYWFTTLPLWEFGTEDIQH